MSRFLSIHPSRPYSLLVGVGGIGTGIVFELSGEHTLRRNESRPGRLLDVRDYCKLHIVSHYVAVLLGADGAVGPLRILPVGKVGDDLNGRRLISEMQAVGLDTRLVETVPFRPTLFSVCFQYPDGCGGNITTSESAASLLSVEDLERVEPLLQEAAGRGIVLAVPEVPLPIRLRLLELGSRLGALRLASMTSGEMAEAERLKFFQKVDLLSINEDEGGTLIDCEFDPSSPERFLDRVSERLRAHNPGIQVLLSAGAMGAFAFDSTKWTHVPAPEVDVCSTAGAGDALFGGAVAGLVSGMDLPKAAELGVLLAAYSVMSPHTIHPEADVDHLLEFARQRDISVSPEITRRIRPQNRHGGSVPRISN